MNTEAFIAEILARPAIWKFGHPQHKYKHIVQRLWEEIKIKFPDSDVSDLKKKWKNLRDTYSKELKKISKSWSGDLSANYEPAWKYFKLLGFLREEYMPLSSESNLDERESAIMDNDDDDTSHDVLNRVRSSPPSCSRTPSPIEPNTSQNSLKKRPKIQDIRLQYLEIERKKLKILEEDLSKNTLDHSENKSDDYHFLMSILPEMEKLPIIQKFRLRNKINQALLEEINLSMIEKVEPTEY